MSLRRCRQLAKMLSGANFVLAVWCLIWGINLGIDWVRRKGTSQPPLELIESTPKPKSQEPLVTLDSLKACWIAPIVEEMPKSVEVIKPPTPKPIEIPVQLPFQWVGVMVHSDPKRSFAILLDERKGEQILVRDQTVMPGTSYRVVEITQDEVKIQAGNGLAILTQPSQDSYFCHNSQNSFFITFSTNIIFVLTDFCSTDA